MRTTVNIPDDLLADAKSEALRRDASLGSVVEAALRRYLSAQHDSEAAELDLPTYGGSGLRPGVDLSDKDALLELLDDPS